MKVGDFVGWADTWSDEEGCSAAGIVLETRTRQTAIAAEWDENYTEFLILYQHNGVVAWEFGSDLVVMFAQAPLKGCIYASR